MKKMNLDTTVAICQGTAHARSKHHWKPGCSWWFKCSVLLSEVRELLWAVIWERDPLRIRAEALDVIAVLVRIVEGDGGSDGN